MVSTPGLATIGATAIAVLTLAYKYGQYRAETQAVHDSYDDRIDEVRELIQETKDEIERERKQRKKEHEVNLKWMSRIHEAVSDDVERPDEVTEVIDIESDNIEVDDD